MTWNSGTARSIGGVYKIRAPSAQKLKPTVQETNKGKRKPTKWERIFPSYIPDRGLKSRLHKEFKRSRHPFKNWTKELNRFLKKKKKV